MKLRIALCALALTLLAPAAASGSPRWLAPQTLSPPGAVAGARVAVDAGGTALAAWSVPSPSPTTRQIVVAARPTGTDAWGAPDGISPPGFVQAGPLAFDAAGGAAALWTLAPPGNPSEAAIAQVAVRQAGEARFGAAQDLSPPTAFAFAPRLAADGTGAMVAVWEERAAGRTGSGVIRAATRAAGAASFGPAEALSRPDEQARQPDVAMDAAGNAVVVWTAGPPGAPATVRARTRPAGAAAWEPEAPLSAAGAACARVAMTPSGAALAAWTVTREGLSSLEAAARPAGGAWAAAEPLGDADAPLLDAPNVVAEPDGAFTIVFLRPDGPGQRLSARVRAPDGAWGARQDLSPPRTRLAPTLLFSGGDRAAAGRDGGVIAVWARSSAPLAVVQAASKPAGAAAFEPAVDISAIGRDATSASAAVTREGEAIAIWVARSAAISFDQSAVEAADLTSRPGAALEPPAVAVAALSAPARAAAGTVVRLQARLAGYVDGARLRPQRLVGTAYVDAGAPVTVSGTSATIPVRLAAGANVLRLAFLDRGAPAASQPVTVTGTRAGRNLIAAGTRPIAVRGGLGALWVLSAEPDGEASVIRIDPVSRRAVGAPIAVGRSGGLAVGAGAVWVAGAPGETPGLRRIDPASMRVTAELPFATTGSVAAGAGAVWTVECSRAGAPGSTCGAQRLMRIDPATNAAAPAVELVSATAENGPLAGGVAAGSNAVWMRMSSTDGSSLRRYDVARGRLATVTDSSGYGATDASGPTLWAVTPRCTLGRTSGTTGPNVVSGRLPDTARHACGQVVAGGRDVWVAQIMKPAPGLAANPALPVRIARIDARTGRTVGVPVTLGQGPATFAVDGGVLWVAYADAGVLTRIDPAPFARKRPLPPRTPAVALAAGRWTGERTLSKGGDPSAPDVALAPGGRAAAAWLRPRGAARVAVEASVRPSAGARWGPVQTLDPHGSRLFGSGLRVEAAGSGEVLALWSNQPVGTAPSLVRTSVLGARAAAFGPAGTISAAGVYAVSPVADAAAGGGALALWACLCTPGVQGVSIMAAARPAGGAFGAPAAIGGIGPIPLVAKAVAVAPSGAAIAAWSPGYPAPGLMVAERTAAGEWSPARTFSDPADPLGTASGPQVALNDRGDALAAWTQNGRVLVSRRTPDGAWSAPQALAAARISSQTAPLVAVDQGGNGLVVLHAPDQATFANRVRAWSHAAGAAGWSGPVPLSPPGPTSGPPGPNAGVPTLAMNGRGAAIVVWAQRVRGSSRVLARQRAGPAAGWGALEDVSGPGRGIVSARAAIDEAGRAAAVWLEREPAGRGTAGRLVVRTADRSTRPG